MSPTDAVRHWASSTYSLPLGEIDRVGFEVQYANRADSLEHFELEIDVRMCDGNQHLYTRHVCEFGQIVDEVLAVC